MCYGGFTAPVFVPFSGVKKKNDIATINGLPVYHATIGEETDGMIRVSLVDAPAVERDFVAMQEQKPLQRYAVESEDKHLVTGVVMRADFPIYRRSEDGFEYYIVYSADTIRKMAEKYLADGRANAVDLMHEGEEVDGVQLVQWMIKGEGVNPAGFEDIADGSLFAQYHITNEDVWQSVKNGDFRGFSLEGYFEIVPETDNGEVQRILKELYNQFNIKDMKMKQILANFAKILATLGSVATDKGVLVYEGDEDLKAGDAVKIETESGDRVDAEDGDYKTADGKVVTIAGGKVSEIKEAEKKEEVTEVTETEVKAAEEETEKPEEEDKGDDLAERVRVLEEVVKSLAAYWGIPIIGPEGGFLFSKPEEGPVEKLAAVEGAVEAMASVVEKLAKTSKATPAHKEFKKETSGTSNDPHAVNLMRILNAGK